MRPTDLSVSGIKKGDEITTHSILEWDLKSQTKNKFAKKISIGISIKTVLVHFLSDQI